MKQWTVNQVRPKLESFKNFLNARGAQVLPSNHTYELIRFKCENKVSIIYYRKDGHTTFCGDAMKAWLCFKNLDYLEWRAVPKLPRTRSPSSSIQALRKRDGDLCFFCCEPVSLDEESQEHLVARTHSGPDHLANKVLAHRKCNADAGHLSVKEKIDIHVASIFDAKGFCVGIKEDNEIIEKAKTILYSRIHTAGALANNAEAVRDYLSLYLSNKERECFGMLALDIEGKVLGNVILFKGTLDHAQIYPREVLKAALRYNSNSVVIYHNHPSGNITPSKGDKDVTKKLKEALALVDIKLVDHIIIAGPKTMSFQQKGLI